MKSFLLRLHGCHGQNLTPLLPPELGAHDAVDAGADGIAALVEKDTGIVAEADDGAVGALGRVLGADDDGVADVSSLDLVGGGHAGHARGGGGAVLLDDDDDAVTYAGGLFGADDEGALDEGGARVVDAAEHALRG